MTFYGDVGHCPKCGRFCGRIRATFKGEMLAKVEGYCIKHGKVDLTNQSWDAELDFDYSGIAEITKRRGVI